MNTITLQEAIQNQLYEGGWFCPGCKNYGGGCKCLANFFIALVGGYTKDCVGFEAKSV